MTHFVKSYIMTKRPSFNQIVMSFSMKMKTSAFWLPNMTRKANLALFLNLIGDVTVFFSNIRIYVSYLWAVIISTFFVCSMKTSPWSEQGLSSVTRLWIRSLKFDLLYIRYHSRYDVGLDTDTENSLLLGVRFSLTKFAQRKNLTKASWQ